MLTHAPTADSLNIVQKLQNHTDMLESVNYNIINKTSGSGVKATHYVEIVVFSHSSVNLRDGGYPIPNLSNIKYKDTPYMSSAPYYGKVHDAG